MRDEAVLGYMVGRFDEKVIAPIAALVLAAMLTVVTLVWWLAAQQDRIALRNEVLLLEAALDARLESDAEMLYDYAFWDDAYLHAHLEPDAAWAEENIGRWASERLGVAMTFILDPQGRTWFGMLRGERADRPADEVLGKDAWRQITTVRRTAPDRARAAFAQVENRIAVIAAAPIGTHTDKLVRRPGPPSLLIQVKFLDPADLTKLGLAYLLPGLRQLDEPEETGASFTLVGSNGRAVTVLGWRSSAPGRDLLAHVLPVLGLAALSVGLLAWVVLRHARDAARAVAMSESRATHDPLTGLQNRRLLDDRLGAAFARLGREGGNLALLYLDLDGFKGVNDSYGHAAGDELLIEVARRLGVLARGTDTVARLGGDEFVILQVAGEQPMGAVRLAEAVIEALGQPVAVDGTTVSVGVSIGIALARPHAGTPRDLARCADMALYAAKNSGRGGYRLFAREPAAVLDGAEVSVPAGLPAHQA